MTRRGRGRSPAALVVISWRDIPAQVNAGSGTTKVQRILPRRFQRAIDQAAMVAGRTQASDYVAEWRRAVEPRPDGLDAEAAAIARAEALEAEFTAARLDAFVATGGWDPARAPETDASTPSSEETRR